jgi:hypothetical protein
MLRIVLPLRVLPLRICNVAVVAVVAVVVVVEKKRGCYIYREGEKDIYTEREKEI